MTGWNGFGRAKLALYLLSPPERVTVERAHGTPYDYERWTGGEPNNAGDGEHCMGLASGASGRWNDMP